MSLRRRVQGAWAECHAGCVVSRVGWRIQGSARTHTLEPVERSKREAMLFRLPLLAEEKVNVCTPFGFNACHKVEPWEDRNRTDWNSDGKTFVEPGRASMTFAGDVPHDGSAWCVRE